MEYYSKSTDETKKLGQRFSADLKGGEIIALKGNLGSGKTTFVQGLAEGLGITSRIVSPTFIIVRNYLTNKNCELYHVDLYRIEENFEEETDSLGLTNIFEEGKDIVVIEWAEKIKDLLPERTIWVSMETVDENQRKITIKT